MYARAKVSINTEVGLSGFCNRLTVDNIVNIIYIKGSKGTGKTSFINYFVNNYTRKLEKQDKTLWFRVDVTKIYDEWKSISKDSKEHKISLLDYLSLQIPFVTRKYRDTSCAFKEILDAVGDKKIFHQINAEAKKQKGNLKKNNLRAILLKSNHRISRQPSYQIINTAKN